MNKALPFLLLLTLLIAPVAVADVPDPAVHTEAQRLDAARATLYKKRALDLRVATPALLASRPDRPDPLAENAWRVVHPKGHEVSIEAVALELHREKELEEYPASVDTTATWVGLWMTVAAASIASSAGVVAAVGKNDGVPVAMGVGAGLTGTAGLVTMIIGAIRHANSDREIPLSAATTMVSEYNASIVDALDGGAPAAEVEVSPAPEVVAKAAPAPAAPAPVAPAPVAPAAAVVPTPAVAESEPAAVAEDQDAAESADDGESPGEVHVGLRLKDQGGVRITALVRRSLKSLRVGDLILDADGIPMPTVAAFRAYAARLRKGDVVVLRVRRASAALSLKIKL